MAMNDVVGLQNFTQAPTAGNDWFTQNAPQGGAQPGSGGILPLTQQQLAGAPQLDPSLGTFTPFTGSAVYYDKTTGQNVDPSDSRITAYMQALQQWGQSQGNGPNSGITSPNQQVGSASGGAAPSITNPNDPNQVRQWLQWQAGQPGADPILQTPGGLDYYQNAILSNGGLTDTNYWANKSTLAKYGGAVGADGGTGGGDNLSGLGYGSLYNTVPTAAQAAATPGYQFIQNEAQNAVLAHQAALGALGTGGTLKALQDRASGLAASNYFGLANLGLNVNQANTNALSNLGQLGLNSSTIGATGRPA